MTRQARTSAEINEWHEQFGQLKQEWLKWLDANGARYQSASDAWSAFKTQQAGHKTTPRIKRWLKKRR
jgi:hypothetical protein